MALADLALIHESPHGGCRSCRNSPGSWLSDTMLKLPFSDKRKGGGSRLRGCLLHLHLHFVCSHGPQRFTQGKRPASERRMQRRRKQWVVEPPQLPQPPTPPPSRQQQVSLCKIVELQAGPLWQGGSHVRHMTPPCANLPPVLGGKWTALCTAAPEYSAVGAQGIRASAPQKHQRKTDNTMCSGP